MKESTMRELNIAYGASRFAKFWSNKTITFEELEERLKMPIRTPETAEEYPHMNKVMKDAAKDHGGFVAGQLRDNRRKADNVVTRSMIVYDIDFATPSFIQNIKKKITYKGCAYSTHSHTPVNPRVRAILPATRDMTPDEYNAVARYAAKDMGFISMVDPCSFEPHQLMYWPSCPSDGEYLFIELEGEVINPDAVLAAHPDWKDCSLLPTTTQESRVLKKPNKKQTSPMDKKGAVGFFCRIYTIDKAIETFLSDVYEPVGNAQDRYTYLPGESTAGLVVYENGTFAYSHHATDPAFGKLVNAFDLVRLHKYPDMEPQKSYRAMAKFVMSLPEVKVLAVEERLKEAKVDFKDTGKDRTWIKDLVYEGGELVNSLHNIRLIMENDPGLQDIVFNELADSLEIKGDVPWKHPSHFWRDADDAQLVSYIDEKYGSFTKRNYEIGVAKVADDRSYHPIKEYFESLPAWDGVPRAASVFINYLGADDNDYVRAVTRKTLCAAYRRVYHPGIKFDYCIVLNGAQGIGKSTVIAKLGMQWYSDSLSLSDMNDKTAAEKLQGFWILEIGELAGMKKADIDKVKAFISRQDDKYRASFGRRVTPHPRQCVFFGTTNSEDGYLRDITGNRRFWNVRVTGDSPRHPWDMMQDTVDQIWAEVKTIAEDESMFLPPDLEDYAKKEQNAAMEQDDREGVVAAYLDMLLPENWEDMDLFDRRSFIHDSGDVTLPKGTVLRETVSNMEIWCECFEKAKEALRPSDAYAIAAMMMKLPGWEKTGERQRLKLYGQQRIYRRKHEK